MAAGLQCWDQNGQIMLDTSDSLCRVVGMFSYPSGYNGSVSVNIGAGRPFYFLAGGSTVGMSPQISFSPDNSVMYVNTPSGVSLPNCNIYYGAY
jgi:hypothetical protein